MDTIKALVLTAVLGLGMILVVGSVACTPELVHAAITVSH